MDRRSFLKRAGAGAALLTAGSGLVKNSAFAINPAKFQAKSDISFVGSSAVGTRRKMISDVLAPWKDKVTAGIAGKTIIIKANLVYWNSFISDPKLSLTHVDAIRGLLDFLRSISASTPIIVGDIPANSMMSTADIMANAGYNALTTEYTGVTLMDLSDSTKFSAVEKGFWTPSFSAASQVKIPISSAFIDPKYYVISLSRPKTHSNMVLTGVNKNILMGAPFNKSTNGSDDVIPKQFMHGANGWTDGTHQDENKCLSYNLFQMANLLYTAGTPALSVLDAWEGMEGDGPASGTSIMQYCAAAGIDPLAVDRITAKLMGFSDIATEPMNSATPSYTDMRALVWISNAGLGNYDLNKINFILGSLSDVEKYVKQYKMCTNYAGSPSYETTWSANAPTSDLDPSGVKDSKALDPKPYLVPQIFKTVSGDVLKIEFSLPVSFKVQLGIFNARGLEVRNLGSQFGLSGRYSVVWNRRDNAGVRAPAGRYFIKLSFDSRSLVDPVSLVN